MYTSHTILDFNLIYIFEFAFKCTLTSFSFLFLAITTHIVNNIYITLIDFIFNIFMCFIFSANSVILMQEYFIQCMIHNSIILLLCIKFSF